MKNKINIAKLLKDCPRDMELDCTMYENVYFDYVDSIGGINCYIKSNDGCLTRVRFLENGCYTTMSNAKCVIFPKGKTTWEGFTPPCNFKEGDVIISDYGNIHLLRTEDSSYCSYRRICENKLDVTVTTSITVVRFATEEEKQELFDAIKANGYKWNAETKTFEKLIEPRFKVGDRIRLKNGGSIIEVTSVNNDSSICVNGMSWTIKIKQQDNYELVPDKFDISTLVPFESRVLVRDNKLQKWHPAMWGFYDLDFQDYPYRIVGGAARYCIPYEKNEYLLGTTNDCDEYYKTW